MLLELVPLLSCQSYVKLLIYYQQVLVLHFLFSFCDCVCCAMIEAWLKPLDRDWRFWILWEVKVMVLFTVEFEALTMIEMGLIVEADFGLRLITRIRYGRGGNWARSGFGISSFTLVLWLEIKVKPLWG